MVSKMPNRKDVKTEETWDLKDLFKTEAEYEIALNDLQKLVKDFVNKYKITDAESVVEVMKDYAKIYEAIIPLGNYSNLSLSVDQTNEEAQARANQFGQIAAKLSSDLSFVNSELLALPLDILKEAMNLDQAYKNYLEKLIKRKPYQ